MKPGHAISLIEVAYRTDVSIEGWLERVAAAVCTAIGSERGAMAFRYDAGSSDWVHVGAMALHRLPPEFAREFFNQPDMRPEAVRALAQLFKSLRFGNVGGFIEDHAVSKLGTVLKRYGITNMAAVNGLDPSGRGCMITVAVNEIDTSPRTVQIWHRLAAHISAGSRLRATLDALENRDSIVDRAEAVLAPDGKVEHAVGSAEPRVAREALRDALVRIEAARAEVRDERRLVELWRGLVAGRWSLVEHFERDGRRYYLAHKNDPELALDRALTPREKQVLAYAELGYSNKLIAYSLGLSSSTVATLLGKAKKKLGMPPHDGSEQ